MTAPRSSLRMMMAGVVIALSGATALTAFAAGEGQEMHGHHMHGGHAMGGGPFMGRLSDRMLDSVNATPEQRTQIRQITEAAVADLKAQRESGRELRQRSIELFKQPTVDANAAEALRKEMLVRHDASSTAHAAGHARGEPRAHAGAARAAGRQDGAAARGDAAPLAGAHAPPAAVTSARPASSAMLTSAPVPSVPGLSLSR